jgi:hypothetical protein
MLTLNPKDELVARAIRQLIENHSAELHELIYKEYSAAGLLEEAPFGLSPLPTFAMS